MEIHHAAHPNPTLATSARLHTIAQNIPLVDQHAHPFYITSDSDSPSTIPQLRTILSEATPLHPNAPLQTAHSTLAFYRSVRDMYHLLKLHHDVQSPSSNSSGSPESKQGNPLSISNEDTVEGTRSKLGPLKLAKVCFNAANIAAVLIDDGLNFSPNVQPVPISQFHSDLKVPVARRVLRLETEAEHVLSRLIRNGQLRCKPKLDGAPPLSNAHCFRAAFRQAIDPLPHHVVSFKSIAAYRSSLDVAVDSTDDQLEYALQDLVQSTESKISTQGCPGQVHLSNKIIIDTVVVIGLQVARHHSIPIQFHCGFGDNDVDIINANPALLRSVFHAFPDVDIVLLHAAWPYVRETAFLASTYPCVYVDFGLAIPLLSTRGMFRVVDALFELAPLDKIMYSSDAHSAPDVFYLASIYGRKVVADVAFASVEVGDLSMDEAEKAVVNILANNAIRIYKLPLQTKTSIELVDR